MKKLLFGVLTAFGVALGANAAIGTTETTFESDDTTTVVTDQTEDGISYLKTGTYWSVNGKEPGVATDSKVMAYEGSERSLKKTENSDYGEVTDKGMTNEAGVNYLQIDADNVLLRNNEATLNGSYYIDTMVKFTATDLSDTQMADEIADGEKIVVWMYQPSEAPANSTEIPAPVLKVAGGFVDSMTSGISVSKKTYTAVGSYNEGTWYRLSVKAISDPFKGVSGGVSFVVCINGTPLTYESYAITASTIASSFTPKTEYREFAGKLIPSRVQGADATKLAGLGFKGNGAVDNILFSAAAPCNALKDGSKVVFFEVNGNSYVTFQEALTAALASGTPATIKLAADLDFSKIDVSSMSAALSIDWPTGTSLADGTIVVLDLNGKEIPAAGNDGISINISGGKTANGTIKIISSSSTRNAIVQGLVVATESEVIIGGDANDTVDKGVTYAKNGMFDGSGFTITLYKGNFVSDPREVGATVATGYEVVAGEVYFTIEQSATTSVTITLGEGIDSATYTINGVPGDNAITERNTVLNNVTIGATITITAKAATGYTANTIDPVTVSADTKVIEVTATPKNYNLTITLGDGVDSATYTLDGAEPVAVVSGTPVSVPYNTAVTIDAKAKEDYTLDEIKDASFTMPAEAKTVSITATKDVTEVTPTITLSATEATFSATLALPTVTVEGYTPDTDYTVSWDKNLPTENPTENVVLTVTVTMKGAYSGSATATFTVKPASYPEFVGGDEAVKAKFDAWVEKYGVADRTDSTAAFQEAYLLNVNPTDAAAIKNAKEEFQITAIKFVDGKLVPTLPNGSKYNGTVKEMGTGSISGNNTTWTEVTTNPDNRKDFKFFKAVLTK